MGRMLGRVSRARNGEKVSRPERGARPSSRQTGIPRRRVARRGAVYRGEAGCDVGEGFAGACAAEPSPAGGVVAARLAAGAFARADVFFAGFFFEAGFGGAALFFTVVPPGARIDVGAAVALRVVVEVRVRAEVESPLEREFRVEVEVRVGVGVEVRVDVEVRVAVELRIEVVLGIEVALGVEVEPRPAGGLTFASSSGSSVAAALAVASALSPSGALFSRSAAGP
jgi:hypothetical protein